VENNLSGRILYCDTNCIVVNKMAGEAVEGASKGMIDLPKLLADEMPGLSLPPASPIEDVLALPTAVHRLDVPVSGCTAFARTGAALRFLNNAFRGSMVEKRYWAIVNSPETAVSANGLKDYLPNLPRLFIGFSLIRGKTSQLPIMNRVGDEKKPYFAAVWPARAGITCFWK